MKDFEPFGYRYDENTGKLYEGGAYMSSGPAELMYAHTCIIPTLEELIEACGAHIDFLVNYPHKYWLAIRNKHTPYEGATPTEAVAFLWLALNKK